MPTLRGRGTDARRHHRQAAADRFDKRPGPRNHLPRPVVDSRAQGRLVCIRRRRERARPRPLHNKPPRHHHGCGLPLHPAGAQPRHTALHGYRYKSVRTAVGGGLHAAEPHLLGDTRRCAARGDDQLAAPVGLHAVCDEQGGRQPFHLDSPAGRSRQRRRRPHTARTAQDAGHDGQRKSGRAFGRPEPHPRRVVL